jgi:hypothetical protein
MLNLEALVLFILARTEQRPSFAEILRSGGIGARGG